MSSCVNLSKFHPHVKVADSLLAQFAGKGFKIGFVGRLDPVKGCEYLLTAFAQLNFAAHLIFVGDGEPRQHLTELANTLGLQDKVTFLGFVACPAAVHRLFDLLVLPSLSESFSNVVVEAQACGVPVIASNVAGPSEIITNGENGLLFPARDSAALAQAIATLYHAPELRATIAQRGGATVHRYSIDTYTQKLNQIYATL